MLEQPCVLSYSFKSGVVVAGKLVNIGDRFGRWVVVKPAEDRLIGKRKAVRVYSECLCDCGCVREVWHTSLLKGGSKSCGCLQRESASSRAKHGHNCSPETRTSEYNSWAAMLARVRNPNNPRWKHYGGRGITVCSEWEDFTTFLADMGLKPGKGYSIDRINNDGNYEPSNCRWATDEQQLENRVNMQRLTFYGMTKTIKEWSAISGNSPKAISTRLENGWPPKYAVWANKSCKLKPLMRKLQQS